MQVNNRIAARRPALLLLPALLLAGCGGGGGSSSPAPPAVPQAVSAVTPSGLTATLAEDKSTILVNGTVSYVLTLTNNTNQSVTFLPLNSLAALPNTTVTAVGGVPTVVSGTGKMLFPPEPTGPIAGGGVGGPSTTLTPGQSVSGTVVPGNIYTASGVFVANATFSLYAGPANTLQMTTVGPLSVTVQ